jgi:L-asparagine transporter-like permease
MIEDSNKTDQEQDADERPPFPHPPWMVGIILILAVLVILAGIADPVWFLIGSPCILALMIYIYVKIERRIRKRG